MRQKISSCCKVLQFSDKLSNCRKSTYALQLQQRIASDRLLHTERKSNKYQSILRKSIGKDRLLKHMIERVDHLLMRVQHMCSIDVDRTYPHVGMGRMTDCADAVSQYVSSVKMCTV
jgi:hypothetical protein